MDSRRRHQEHQKQQLPQLIPWDSRMVAEVDIICRSKVPRILDFDIDACEPPSLSEYEYDFILERQILADYEQYWDQKRRAECSTPGSLINPTEQPLSPRAGSCTPTIAISPGPAVVSTESHKVELESKIAVPTLSPVKADSVEPLPESPLNPPVAAKHLLSGGVLQPSRTEASSIPTHSRVSSFCDSKPPLESASYLRDFDSGPDDPFASTELKTINDLEELRNVLSSSIDNQNTQSIIKQHTQKRTPPTSVVMEDGYPAYPSVSYSPSSNKRQLDLHCPRAPPSFGPLACSPTRCSFSPTFHPQHTPVQSVQLSSLSGSSAANTINGLTVLPGRSLSSSVPNFEAAGLTERPNSVAGVTLSTIPHPRVPTKSTQSFDPQLFSGVSQQRSCFYRPAARTPAELDALIEILIDWARQTGLPETRARGLLQIPQNRSRFSQLSVDKAKQQLTEQLRLVQLLLNEYAPVSGSSNRLSEQTAVVAVSAFPHDVLKARQFAKVALDLEQCGHPQEVTQSFLLDAKVSQEATLAQILSALPRPAVLPRPLPPSGPSSWQPAPITRPQTKR